MKVYYIVTDLNIDTTPAEWPRLSINPTLLPRQNLPFIQKTMARFRLQASRLVMSAENSKTHMQNGLTSLL